MPPVRKGDREAVRKRVDFVAKDEDQQIATGIVMVPDKVDLQGDFARDETIEGFADQFGALIDAGEADGGVMHAVWPSEWMALEENTVLSEETDLGGTTVRAGAWRQDWQFSDDGLWGLVEDDVISGLSIGAVDVDWNGPFDPDEVENVELPDEHPEDAPIWELTDGIIREVSAVDIPAVPDAQILETKDAYEKRLADHLGNQDAFIEEAIERGHSEAEAERLWEVLTRGMDVDGSGSPGKTSRLERIGKAVIGALTPGSDGADAADAVTRAEVLRTFPEDAPIPDDIEEFDECVDWAEDQDDIDDPDSFCGNYWEPEDSAEAAKEGRTLSDQNAADLKAVMDAAASVFRDAGRDPGFTRFTDREDDGFDLTEHTAREFDDPDENEDEDEAAEGVPIVNHAAGGDTPDADGSDTDSDTDTDTDTTMSDTDDPDEPGKNDGEDKTLAEKNAEQITELTETVTEIADAVTEDAPEKTVELEIGGEIVEVTESEAKAWFDEGIEPGQPADPMADAPAWAKHLKADVERQAATVENLKRQGGFSDQIDAAKTNGHGDDDPLDDLAKLLS